jgi:hypothetical protein
VRVDHVVVAVAFDAALDVGGVGARHPRLGHREARPDLAVQQRKQPFLLLLRCAELGEDLHVAGVGGGAVRGLRRQQVAAHQLAERRVVEVRQARAPLLVGEEQVPEAALARLGLELLHDRRMEVRVARLLHLAPVHGLGRDDVGVDEIAELLLEVERSGAELEVHRGER